VSYLLQIKGLTTCFMTDHGVVTAVDNLSLNLEYGETLTIVGESGCGKSVTGLSIMRLIASPPGNITSGAILFKGRDILSFSETGMRRIRGNQIAMVFQEPMSSLNPVYSIGYQIMEVIELHEKIRRKSARERVYKLLEKVAIPDPVKRFNEYPHELSGGMRQRVMIAMALACNPDILIADEPTTALDVTIQAQILELLMTLRKDLGLSILLITHDLGVVAETADRVAVMYAGRLVETAGADDLFSKPLHPYTQGLLASAPVIEPLSNCTNDCLCFESGTKDRIKTRKKLFAIPGMVPSLLNLPSGCSFAPRCSRAHEPCTDSGKLSDMTPLDNGRSVRCVLYPKAE
jgi:oligopeptide/dipeptide ABC transporter ATP-binding protein